MSKTRIAGQLERLIQGLREKESAKKSELLEIQKHEYPKIRDQDSKRLNNMRF